MEIHGYTESGSIEATIDGQRWSVPDEPGNRFRQMIAEWEAEGNTIPAYVPPPEPEPEPDYDAELVKAITDAPNTVEGLKAALIGNLTGSKARVSGRPKR